MGSVTGSESINRSHSTDQYNEQQDGNFDRKATFDPRADAIIKSLTQAGGSNTDQKAVNASYLQSLQESNTGNPYVQDAIKGQNIEADKQFKNRLSQVRAGGYRGGVGRDTINQGNFVSDFTNKQYTDNARLLADNYQQAQGNRIAAASGLTNAETARQGSAIALLNTLRGEAGSTAQKTSGLKRNDTRSRSIGLSGGASFGG